MPYYERNLPHWLPTGRDLFVTWRLSGSLPAGVIEQLKNKKFLREGERFREFDSHLDSQAFGPVWLKQPQLAALVVVALKDVQQKGLCRLHSYVMMPNHVHLLLTPVAALERITFLIKGRTAYQANLLLQRREKRFWQNESFDHWIRNSAEFQRVQTYIERNPVKAGLVARPEEWKWSSASSIGFSLCSDPINPTNSNAPTYK